MGSSIVLVNPNSLSPPVAPVALEYLRSALDQRGLRCEIIDLNPVGDGRLDFLRDELTRAAPFDAVGVTLRNFDDAASTTQSFYYESTEAVILALRRLTPKPLILGGAGYSVAPRSILERTGADFGVVGEGEFSLVELLIHLDEPSKHGSIPGLVHRAADGSVRVNAPAAGDLKALHRRRCPINGAFYHDALSVTAMAGLELSRGCPFSCVYCVEPMIKGREVRRRSTAQLIGEVEELVQAGIAGFHAADSELNLDLDLLVDFCGAMSASGLNDELVWCGYALPRPFDEQLARTLMRAGCRGINFGIDSANDRLLKSLKRPFRQRDIVHAARCCTDAGLTFRFDLLLGVPGETRSSLEETFALVRRLQPDQVGVNIGVRAYGGTEFGDTFQKGRQDPVDLFRPTFYVQQLEDGDDVERYVDELCDGDDIFMR